MEEELIPGLPEEVARECLVRVDYDLFSRVSSVCRLWRREVESPLFHRIRKSEKFARGIVVLAQAGTAVGQSAGPAPKHGQSASYRLTVLDPASGSWTALPPVPFLSAGLPLFCQLAAVDKKLVVVGGWDPVTWAPSDGVYVYDFLSEAWRCGARVPGRRRSFAACAAMGGAVYVAGGHDGEKNALRSAMRYNVEADEWAPLPDMAKERDECKGVCVGGKFHVIDGYSTDGQGQFSNCSEAFDATAGRWDPVEEDRLEAATCPRTCVAEESTEEGRLYVVRSGHVAEGAGGKWKEVVEVPEDAAVAVQLVRWQGKLLLLGSGSHGGALVGYLLETADGSGKMTWQKISVPEEYSDYVQAACCLEI